MPKKRSDRERSEFGARMQRVRKWTDLSQTYVAKTLGCGQSTVSDAEGLSTASSYTVRFARLYGVDPLWLECGEGVEPDWSRPWGESVPANSSDPTTVADATAEVAALMRKMTADQLDVLLATAGALVQPKIKPTAAPVAPDVGPSTKPLRDRKKHDA